MSPRGSTAQPQASDQIEQKQRFNIYTMMLILSFFAICVACVLLWMELQPYGSFPWWKTEGVTPATSAVVPLYEYAGTVITPMAGSIA